MVEVYQLNNAQNNFFAPRRVMKYVLFFCSDGNMKLQIDENEFKLKKNDVITITSGQIHFIKNTKNFKGYVLEFTLDFFCKDDNDIELVFHNGLFCHFDLNEVIPINNVDLVETQLKLIEQEIKDKPYQYLISIHSRVTLILVEINRSKVNRGDEIYKPTALFLKFLELVRNNFEKGYSLSSFAKQLGVSTAKLNEQAKFVAGKTAQNVIYGLIISEAKRLLVYQKSTIKELTYKLGFKDQFYFSNFFKKHTGISPKSYKEKNTL